jgi:hypothetical protein
MNSEEQYIRLIHEASNKYANWDPEQPVRVGDWGDFVKAEVQPWWESWFGGSNQGIFKKQGNIYDDNIAEKYGIPKPTERGADSEASGITWLTSSNTAELSESGESGG